MLVVFSILFAILLINLYINRKLRSKQSKVADLLFSLMCQHCDQKTEYLVYIKHKDLYKLKKIDMLRGESTIIFSGPAWLLELNRNKWGGCVIHIDSMQLKDVNYKILDDTLVVIKKKNRYIWLHDIEEFLTQLSQRENGANSLA